MNILDKIIADKKIEIGQSRSLVGEDALRKMPFFSRRCVSLKQSLLAEDASGIIAEFKRKSPSKGWINQNAELQQVVTDYSTYGSSAISVLTDENYFGGSLDDLSEARKYFDGPILRKDFIVDEYQI